ncbi:HAD family hydrolase [Bacillus pinisoli]|uniref:HAD family hydrolase n=1 Tax=Bacillus pinisoli TaxID=2901866 RepID=UPI001FF54D16|nr:HAD family hydrolase [Bacillus pinisoli]
MIKAVIFDFDGLIVDTETVWFHAYKEAFAEYDCDLQVHDFALCIGTTDDVLFERMSGLTSQPIDRHLINQKVHALYENEMEKLQLRDGVLDYLKIAKQKGLKIGLASSSSRKWVESFLNKFEIKGYFDIIRTSDDVKMVKPDPELYFQAIEGLNVKANDTVVFEDSKNGLVAALKAGLHCVVVPNPVTKLIKFEGHIHRIESMSYIGFEQLLLQLEEKMIK